MIPGNHSENRWKECFFFFFFIHVELILAPWENRVFAENVSSLVDTEMTLFNFLIKGNLKIATFNINNHKVSQVKTFSLTWVAKSFNVLVFLFPMCYSLYSLYLLFNIWFHTWFQSSGHKASVWSRKIQKGERIWLPAYHEWVHWTVNLPCI